MTVTIQGILIPCIGCTAEVEPIQPPAKCVIHGFVSAIGMAALEPKVIAFYVAALCDAHTPLMAMALTSFAEKNAIPHVELTKSLEGLWK